MCPVEFAYFYPQNFRSDHRRWLAGFVKQQKEPQFNLHNHPIHGSSKVCSKVKEVISNAAALNPSIRPSEIAKGVEVPIIPGAIDKASNHLGKISRELHKEKRLTSAGSNWDVTHFEAIADDLDINDDKYSGDAGSSSNQMRKLSRPYLASVGIENGIKFRCCMNPLMSSILAESEFIEADITYNETKEYPYLFNVVAFNDVTLEWVVVSRVRMDKQDGNAYAFKNVKLITQILSQRKHSRGLLDWSDAEIKGLSQAVGQDMAIELLKGCAIHWTRSWQRVRDRVATTSNDKSPEKYLYALIA